VQTAVFLGVYVGAEVSAGGLVSSYILVRDLASKDVAYITPSFFWVRTTTSYQDGFVD